MEELNPVKNCVERSVIYSIEIEEVREEIMVQRAIIENATNKIWKLDARLSHLNNAVNKNLNEALTQIA